MNRLLCTLFVFGLWMGGPMRSAHAQTLTGSIVTEQSTLAYTGRHAVHDWTGTSRVVTGTVTVDLADPAQSTVVVTVPVESFDSGNGRRDRKMRDLVEADRFPEVHFTSTAVAVEAWTETADGYQGTWRIQGTLAFHGRTHPVEIPATVRVTDGQLEAVCDFQVSLEQFEVHRPRLLFVPIGDVLTLEGILRAPLAPTTASR
jgi:polyisoprenoid-binding protein YceI